MLVKSCNRLTAYLLPVLIFTYVAYRYNRWDINPIFPTVPPFGQGVGLGSSNGGGIGFGSSSSSSSSIQSQPRPPAPNVSWHWSEKEVNDGAYMPAKLADGTLAGNTMFNEIFSVSTASGKFFDVRFDLATLNPNIIKHPHKKDQWIMVAQEEMEQTRPNKTGGEFAEWVCNAAFQDNKLMCAEPTVQLPVAETEGGKCDGDIAYFNFAFGPHDARLQYGPEAPYLIYGSNSRFTCFGIFIQDLRALLDDFKSEQDSITLFKKGTEIQRPKPYGRVEKNWFVFWDMDNKIYAHWDVYPIRSFGQIGSDGAMVGPDLGKAVNTTDQQCMDKYMPKLANGLESIHQATNSLSITLCKRADASCQVTEANTFVLHMFQLKRMHGWHGVYEPVVQMFRRVAPFDLVGIGAKPLWISGRSNFTRESGVHWKPQNPIPKGQSEMFYVTSISWKENKYHGYLDDIMLINFGIEDSYTGSIDVLGGDVLQDLRLCGDERDIGL